MAASLPSFSNVNSRCSYPKWSNRRQVLKVIKFQSFQEEGRSTNIVDANLNALKERIEMVKVKERLERCCRCQHGWNYAPVYNHKLKRSSKELSKLVELSFLVCGTIGFTCVSGTFLLCLVSLLVHMQ
ncbi:hypothetical protein L6164_007809 [Bauhinia variegata]|uniref:Uncharacterized protein n=1 Tax=Bauhinia variegata TaxID=167791 RepID=A0ACB9PDQ4_BAUVA|nr:hypothetical protein L6164_007809 [Bauhinia variegata]